VENIVRDRGKFAGLVPGRDLVRKSSSDEMPDSNLPTRSIAASSNGHSQLSGDVNLDAFLISCSLSSPGQLQGGKSRNRFVFVGPPVRKTQNCVLNAGADALPAEGQAKKHQNVRRPGKLTIRKK
jgi:hypothetical protein